jgi:hypothetical protein
MAEAEKQLKAVTTDQARLRENLQIIPQSAEPYKRFLDKFVTQETEIEALQRRRHLPNLALQAQEREHLMFVANLNVD